MPRLELRPFSDECVAAAGELLAGRHRREPLLPDRYGSPAAVTELVAKLADRDGYRHIP